MDGGKGRERQGTWQLPVLQPRFVPPVWEMSGEGPAETRGEPARRGEGAAYQLQVEYMAWRREHGLEPTADQLNAFELAWERLGEAE